jgi:hypothetical protein
MLVESKIENLLVNDATYLDGYKISIAFNDGKINIVDFKPFLESKQNSHLIKYLDTSLFKKFHIDNGNLVWGKNWDLIFPVKQLYKGQIKL